MLHCHEITGARQQLQLCSMTQETCYRGSHLVILQESGAARLLFLKKSGLVLLQDLSLHLLQQAGATALVHVVGHALLL